MIQDIAPHQYDVTYRKTEAKDSDIMLIYQNGSLLCHMEEEEIIYPTVKEIAEIVPNIYEKAKFLFRIDKKDYFELRNPKICEFGKWTYLSKDSIRNVRPIWKAFAAITGFQIHKWYTDNQFCGRCGTKMQALEKERAMKCQHCGKISYPQICPSVIIGITDGNRILMTKYASNHSKYKKYALVAGYAEVGESLEATVRRETMEEVGLKVKNIRYYKSQPWSFSDALLVGFFCEVDGDNEIVMDKDELSAAEWFDRENLPTERSEASISLTGEMIDAFRDGLV
ncbi:MAG: NAD(+) diphosphatase [Lachnospiraceae bacterium]|nr:NAD(+) diphosphatase [Lachnospiraceae bacterium]